MVNGEQRRDPSDIRSSQSEYPALERVKSSDIFQSNNLGGITLHVSLSVAFIVRPVNRPEPATGHIVDGVPSMSFRGSTVDRSLGVLRDLVGNV